LADPPPTVTTTTATSFNPGPLIGNTTYYWRISASDGLSVTGGPIWRFSTLAREHPVYLPLIFKGVVGSAAEARIGFVGCKITTLDSAQVEMDFTAMAYLELLRRNAPA